LCAFLTEMTISFDEIRCSTSDVIAKTLLFWSSPFADVITTLLGRWGGGRPFSTRGWSCSTSSFSVIFKASLFSIITINDNYHWKNIIASLQLKLVFHYRLSFLNGKLHENRLSDWEPLFKNDVLVQHYIITLQQFLPFDVSLLVFTKTLFFQHYRNSLNIHPLCVFFFCFLSLQYWNIPFSLLCFVCSCYPG
jgi:hypothetical protein